MCSKHSIYEVELREKTRENIKQFQPSTKFVFEGEQPYLHIISILTFVLWSKSSVTMFPIRSDFYQFIATTCRRTTRNEHIEKFHSQKTSKSQRRRVFSFFLRIYYECVMVEWLDCKQRICTNLTLSSMWTFEMGLGG
jgi:hypothetical protein